MIQQKVRKIKRPFFNAPFQYSQSKILGLNKDVFIKKLRYDKV